MAQPNMFGVTEFDQDPETAAELMRLKRQQQIADAMYGQSQQPLQGGMVGQVYVPPSITQGLAKLFQGYSAGQMARGVEEGYKGVIDRRKAVEDAELAKYKQGVFGSPEQPMGPPTPEGEMGVKAAVPATPESRSQAIIEAIAGNSPRLARMAQMQFQMDSAAQSRKDAAQARIDQINEAERQRRITKEEADARRAEEAVKESRRERENKEFLLRLGSSLKQSAGTAATKAPSGYRFTPEGDLEAIKGGPADVKAQINQQKEVDKAAGVDKQLDAIERNIDKIMTPEGVAKPALKSYTGQLDQYYPEWAMSSDTAAAGSALKSLQEQMTMMNLAGAKAAVGQSFGSMQVKEWDKFMNLLTNVSRGVPDEEMESNLKFIRNFVKDKRDVLRTAIYGGTHGIGGPKPSAGAQSSSGGKPDVRSEADKILGL